MQENHLLWLETGENEKKEMELRVRIVPAVREGEVQLKITGTDGYEKECCAAPDKDTGEAAFALPGVKLWDTEHPRLYHVAAACREGERVTAAYEGKIGFRQLDRQGNQIFWNHVPLKLKGICYRERKDDWEGTKKDMELFAGANINFIRSIFAPFSRRLLELCDEMGFLVENTAPFWEIGQAKAAVQDLPHEKEGFLAPVREMLAQGSHVSVLLWSLGHDCAWGSNFREAASYIRSIDRVRPLTFHLPMSVPQEDTGLDVWPLHYVDWKQPFDVCYDQMVIFHTPGTTKNEIGYMTARAEPELPVLHEIWSPVANHNRAEIWHDPSVRRFWKESITRFADKAYRTKGCLGGAVLAGVDEDGSFEDMGGYAWGILTKDHKPKPEYEALRSAYAPVQVTDCRIENGRVYLCVENRFLYTNLSEIAVSLQGVRQENIFLPETSKEQKDTDNRPKQELRAEPGCQAQIMLSLENIHRQALADNHNFLQIEFIKKEDGTVCGEAVLDMEPAGTKDVKTAVSSGPLQIQEEESRILISNETLRYRFSKESCLLEEASAGGRTLLAGGPYLNATGFTLGEWQGRELKAKMNGDKAEITILGTYEGAAAVKFLLLIAADGTIDVSYEPLKLYRPMPHTVKADTGMAPGGLNEKGVSFLLPSGAKDFSFRNAERYGHLDLTDEKDRENARGSVYQVQKAVISYGEGAGVCVLSEGRDSVRLERARWLNPLALVDDRDGRMRYSGSWYRMNDYCGSMKDTETLSKNAGDTMQLTFTGTGVELYGAHDINYGICQVSLDRKVIAESISQYPDKVDFPGMSRGYEKIYRQPLCSVHGLSEGEHTLLVTVLGQKEKDAQNTYTSVDYAVLEGALYPEGIMLHVNQDYNFNRLVRGCYKRPRVVLTEGVREHCRIRLCAEGIQNGGDSV